MTYPKTTSIAVLTLVAMFCALPGAAQDGGKGKGNGKSKAPNHHMNHETRLLERERAKAEKQKRIARRQEAMNDQPKYQKPEKVRVPLTTLSLDEPSEGWLVDVSQSVEVKFDDGSEGFDYYDVHVLVVDSQYTPTATPYEEDMATPLDRVGNTDTWEGWAMTIETADGAKTKGGTTNDKVCAWLAYLDAQGNEQWDIMLSAGGAVHIVNVDPYSN